MKVDSPFHQPPVTQPDARRWESGIASLDAALAGGLACGRIHEVFAPDIGDGPAAAGFVAAVATGMACVGKLASSKAIVWLRPSRSVKQGGTFQANGWAELGAPADACLVALVPDTLALLRAAHDALRCSALGAVVIEGWGRMAELDLTASRRFALAAEASGVPLLLLRIDAEPQPSAAQTRWQVAAAPSQALPGKAPGMPTFDVELLRQKSGPSGLGWRLEWDRDARLFREAALPGAVVPVPARGSAPPSAVGATTGGTAERMGIVAITGQRAA